MSRLAKSSGDAGTGTCGTVPAEVPVTFLFTSLSFPRLFSNASSSHINLFVILCCYFSAEYRLAATDMSATNQRALQRHYGYVVVGLCAGCGLEVKVLYQDGNSSSFRWGKACEVRLSLIHI